MMADLPAACLQIFDSPFAHSGIEYFGSFYVERKSTTKRCGCVFTCKTTQAVHIMMAAVMKTHCFIPALQRFISRR